MSTGWQKKFDELISTRWERRFAALARLPKPPAIEAANRRMTRRLVVAGIGMFVLGLVWPTGWSHLFGPAALLIGFAADAVPSIGKAASVSPMPELVRGYLGALALLTPVLTATILYKEPLDKRFTYAFQQPRAGPIRRFLFLYVLFLPALIAMLCVVWFLPIEVRLGLTPTRGQLIFHLMMTNRVALAAFGSLLAIGVALFVWLLGALLVGPVWLLIRRILSR